MIPARQKQPTESRSQTFDFSDKLSPGDTVLSITSVLVPSGITATAGTLVGNTVTVRFSGGAAGTDYLAQVRVTTTNGDILELDCTIEVREDAN